MTHSDSKHHLNNIVIRPGYVVEPGNDYCRVTSRVLRTHQLF